VQSLSRGCTSRENLFFNDSGLVGYQDRRHANANRNTYTNSNTDTDINTNNNTNTNTMGSNRMRGKWRILGK